jgi:tRNA (cytidine/uridine-2'-O-)-methyltransferase
MRLASNSGCNLHLIGPLGFDLQEKNLRRAHLDYREYANVSVHAGWHEFVAEARPSRIWAFSTKGKRNYAQVRFQTGDFLLFGPETRGLPADLMQEEGIEGVLALPMMPNSRSMNLSNTVAVVVYEAWRQNGFEGALEAPIKTGNQ